MAYTTIGNTAAVWDDNEPLIFTLSEEIGSKYDRRVTTYVFNLTGLRAGFEEEFLLDLKDLLIERRHRVALVTVKADYQNIELLFRKIIDHNLLDKKISVIDETFLLAMNTIIEQLSSVCLLTLRRIFNFNPYCSLFAKRLRVEDFQVKSVKKGFHGRIIDSILAKALTRSACVEILRRCEEAYEDGTIDIGLFSSINLAFSVYVRPDSYRRIRLSDLVYDTATDAFFLYIPPAKSGVHQPKKINYQINKRVGILLLKQRQQVIERFGHLVNKDDIGMLALFPARKRKKDKSGWVSEHANESLGELPTGSQFNEAYFGTIREIVLNNQYVVNGYSLRHTVGTQLAELGCSAKTIQAVLKHAGDQTCMAYVDIAFHGLINELSDAMQPAFEAHLPAFDKFRSKDGFVAPNKAVYSEDLEMGRTELTGECGKEIRCQAAPFTCYECNKFIPCFDADHSLNLNIIQADIDKYKHAGTPFRHLVEKSKSVNYRIQLVMAACDRYQQAVAEKKGGHD